MKCGDRLDESIMMRVSIKGSVSEEDCRGKFKWKDTMNRSREFDETNYRWDRRRGKKPQKTKGMICVFE